MKAAYYLQPGPPDVIQYGELPIPSPANGKVLVRVHAAAVNPIDTYIRSGIVKMPQPVPTIPGCDFAGVVEAVGPEVHRFKVGDRVWGSNQGLLGRQGTFAEYCSVDEQWVYPTPKNVTDTDIAALALTGITAHLGLFEFGKIVPGETVFVNGGTGGVGSLVVQMAHHYGAKVITTVGSEEKAKVAQDLGADCVINYKTANLTTEVKKFINGEGVNLWYETLPPTDFDQTVDLMAQRGRIVVMAGRSARPVLPNGPFYVKLLNLAGFAMFNLSADMQRISASAINSWAAEGKLKALVGATFPLHESAKAHALKEENTIGKAGTLTGKILISVRA